MPDESLLGFVFRLTRLRRTEGPFAFTCRLGFPAFWVRPDADFLHRLAKEIGQPVEELWPLWRGHPGDPYVLFNGLRLPASSLDGPIPSYRKVCPACLVELGRHLAVWEFSFISACPAHGTALLDACPKCSNLLRWRGYDLKRCGCNNNVDLTRLQAPQISPEATYATACIQGLLGDARYATYAAEVRRMAPFRDMPSERVVEFLFRLGLEAASDVSRKRYFAFERAGAYDTRSHDALAEALGIVRRWPEGFFDFLDRVRRRYVLNTVASVRRVTIPVERWARALRPPAGDTILEALDRYRGHGDSLG